MVNPKNNKYYYKTDIQLRAIAVDKLYEYDQAGFNAVECLQMLELDDKELVDILRESRIGLIDVYRQMRVRYYLD